MIKVEDFKKALESKEVNLICPVCKANIFSAITDITSNVPIDWNGDIQIGKGQMTPKIQMVCNKCGYVMEFDPRYLELL
ncbi:hypothetical protein [Tissierella sp.]|uniref:hypothetical protein n=1 Tax=Tissierella sp. TaxID=41274 RepID=UPI00303187CD